MKKKKMENLIVHPSVTLRHVLEALNKENPYQIVFTADEDNKINGCITDGDIRRGLLRGESLESPASRVARKTFISTSKGTPSREILPLMRRAGVRQIPVLDDQGHLLDVKLLEDFVRSTEQAVDFPVLIMAGGRGERLRPYTEKVPKPLLKVGDRAVIERLIQDFQSKGITEFYISVNYLAEQIMEHLGDSESRGCKLEYLRESKPLGTAGSLSLLKGKVNSDFLVINGDILSTIDLRMLSQFHAEHEAMVTVCAKLFTVNIPYGVVKLEDGNILSIEEKPDLSVTINAGIYFFSPKVLEMIEDDQYLDMPTLLNRLIAQGHTVKCFESTEPWIDIGSIADYEKAHKYLEYLTK